MAKRLLWALGGPLGLHHVYLGRDSHALLRLLTPAGFGASRLWDFRHLPAQVATANGTTGQRGTAAGPCQPSAPCAWRGR